MSETQISPVFPQEIKAVQEQPKPVRWIEESHKAFQKDLESRGMSPNTVRLYLSALKLYFSLYEQLNVENLHSFKAYLLSHYKVSTVNSRIHGINRFLNFLEEGRVPEAEKISAELEGFRLTAVKEQQKAFLDNVISQEDYEQLKYCLKKDGYILWYFVVHFLGSCGLRVSELLQIKAEHIRMEYMDLYSKGGKIRRVFFPGIPVSGSRTMAARTGAGSRLCVYQPQRRTLYGQRNPSAAQILCPPLRHPRGNRLPPFLPAPLRAEFSLPVQRHRLAGRPDGPRQHRDHPHLPDPFFQGNAAAHR